MATDGARRDLQHEDPIPVHPHLGVNRTFRDADRPEGALEHRDDSPLRFGTGPRWRQVDRLFEERPLQRVGLVEEREDEEAAPRQQGFEGELLSGDVLLDQEVTRFVTASPAQLGICQQCGDPRVCGGELVGVVRADHSAAGGQEGGFQHTRKLHAAGQRPRIVIDTNTLVARSGKAGLREPAAQPELVSGDRDRLHRVRREPQSVRGLRRDQGRLLVDADHCIQRVTLRESLDRGDGGIGFSKVQRQGAPGNRRLEHLTAIPPHHHLDAQPACRLEKIFRAVARSRYEEQRPRHLPRICAQGGSAMLAVCRRRARPF